ncbi:MAG: ABC transporter permease [Planctomycetes bacterium]|nr:ABC transporter permease [Planctomycetota bacterium]
MGAIFALAIKDLRQLVRDKSSAFFTFVFPLLVAVFFGVIFGGGGGSSKINVVVVNEDGGEAAASFAEDIAGDSSLDVTAAPSRSEGENLVRLGKASACIVIPKGFGAAAGNMFGGGTMKVEGVIDPSRKAEGGLLTGKLNELAFRQMSKTFSDVTKMDKALENAKQSIVASPDVNDSDRMLFSLMFDAIGKVNRTTRQKAQNAAATDGATKEENKSALAGWQPVRVSFQELPAQDNKPRSSFQISFTQGIIWGLMGCVTAFGVSLASERTRGTLMRLTVSPMSRGQILAGKALACFVACLLVQAMLVVFGVLPPFNVRIGQPLLMAVACVASAIGFTGIMMLMAGMSRSEGGGAGMGRALILVLAMIGGGTVPMFFMPPFMQTVSKVSPFSWATTAMEGAIWRGYTIEQMLLPVGVLLGFGAAGFVIGVVSLRWSSDR